MKKAIRIAALLLAVVMMFACLAACGKKDSSTGDDNEKVYTIASDTAFKPFEYLDTETNTYIGFDMDILAAIAEDQGFKYTMDNIGFDPACARVQAGQADAMIAGMTIKPDREEIYDFSDGYFEDGQIMVVAADSDIASIEDLAGKIVATKAGTMGLEYAEENKDTYGYTTMMFESSPEMYQAVAQGTCVACFEDRSVIGAAITDGQPLKTVGDTINPAYYGFAVAKGQNPELIEMFNAGLKNIIDNGEYDRLLEKYGM